MDPAVEELLAVQAGVLSRRQLLALGLADHDIARMLRRRIWATVHEGVYVKHTGEHTWLQRAWAAVLFSWPAALSHGSALEHGYLNRVERVYRDAAYTEHVLVELDGRLFHDSTGARDRDFDRDLVALVGGKVTRNAPLRG